MATKLKRVIARMHEFDIFGGHGSEFFFNLEATDLEPFAHPAFLYFRLLLSIKSL